MFAWLSALAFTTVWTGPPPPGAPEAIALLGTRIFVGTERGLYRAAEIGFEPLFTRAAVGDLAAQPGGLLLATERGLYEWREGERRVYARPLGSGASVHAVAVGSDGNAWVATGAGLFVRESAGEPFRRVAELRAHDVRGVRTSANRVWAATRGTLWLRREGSGFVPLRRGLAEGWWEIVDVAERPNGTLLAVPRGLWRLEGRELHRIELGLGRVRALSTSGGTVWVATERGVFTLDGADSPALGEGLPLGSRSVLPVPASDLAVGRGRIWVATRTGIVAFAPRSTGARPRTPALHASAANVLDVVRVHRAVLAYLGLSPSRLRTLERRARFAGLWPAFTAGLILDRDRDRARDRDQVVSGGRLFELFDTDRERRSTLRFDVKLAWDLERLASPSDALAVSKERREVVELVERILDRVNEVFFEREGALGRLARLPEERDEERGALRLRVRKLTATLDGWTGGAFSREIARGPSPPREPRPREPQP